MGKKLIYIATTFLLISCGNKNSGLEKEYIKNLEEKNAILEEELETLRNSIQQQGYESSPNPEKTAKTKQSYDRNLQLTQDSVEAASTVNSTYFTIGSTEAEVLRVMGDPTSIQGSDRNKIYWYNHDYVQFRNGEVENYSNSDGGLKVRVSR